MNETGTGLKPDSFRLPLKRQKPDYKQKLERTPVQKHAADVLAAEASPVTEGVRALAGQPGVDGVAFQCVAVAALQTLERARRCEIEAAEAALSLAQRENLEVMAEAVDATAGVLRETLTAQGAKMLAKGAPAGCSAPEHSWWFALSEALHVLGGGITWIESVTAGQPANSPTYTLGDLLSQLLQQHYDALLVEAERWMS